MAARRRAANERKKRIALEIAAKAKAKMMSRPTREGRGRQRISSVAEIERIATQPMLFETFAELPSPRFESPGFSGGSFGSFDLSPNDVLSMVRTPSPAQKLVATSRPTSMGGLSTALDAVEKTTGALTPLLKAYMDDRNDRRAQDREGDRLRRETRRQDALFQEQMAGLRAARQRESKLASTQQAAMLAEVIRSFRP